MHSSSLCLEDVASPRQAALNQPQWQDGLTDGASLVELVLREGLPGSRMRMSGTVPVPFLSAGLSLPPRRAELPRVLMSLPPLLPAPWAALVSHSGAVV